MNRVLITGAAGFVGTALTTRLMEAGDFVVTAVRDRTRTAGGNATAYGDVVDQDFCRRVVAEYEVDTIYHLAAQSIVSVCAEDPVGALEVAVMGTARLLQAVRDVGRPVRVVVMTSDKVYGHAPPPYTEATPFDARHPYEVSKACQDLVARMFHSAYDSDVSVVRAVNIYGPGDPNTSRLIPQTIARCLRREPPRIHAGAGSMKRQYVFIDDMLGALQFVAKRGRAGEAYCVGSPSPALSVVEVITEICRQFDLPFQVPEVKPRDPRFQEIETQAVDGAKLAALGWTPKIVFERGVATTIAATR